jgi:hypothetical protein
MARKTKPEPLTRYIGGRLYRAVIDGNKRISAWEPVESAPEPDGGQPDGEDGDDE